MNEREQPSDDPNKDLSYLKKFMKYNYERNNGLGISSIIVGLVCITESIIRGIEVGIGYTDIIYMFACIAFVALSFLLLFKNLTGTFLFLFWLVLFCYTVVTMSKMLWENLIKLYDYLMAFIAVKWQGIFFQ